MKVITESTDTECDFVNPVYRRFELITDNKEQEKAFQALVEQKGLTREDLMLILKTVKIASTDNG